MKFGSVERITPKFNVLYQANLAFVMLELADNVVEKPEHMVVGVGLTKTGVLVTVTATVVDGLPQEVLAVTV